MKTLFTLFFGLALGALAAWFFLTTVRDATTAPWSPGGPSPRGAEGGPPDTEKGELLSEMNRRGAELSRRARHLGERIVDAAGDARITAEIKGRLMRHSALSAWDISVTTIEGHVTLSGQVESAEQIGEAIREALSVEGVGDVVSTLRLKPVPAEFQEATVPASESKE